MAYVSGIPARRNSHLIPAGIALLLGGLVAPLHITLLGASWPLIWVPFAVVAMWPGRASALPSALMLLLGGLWVDWATLGPMGQWSLVYLVTYAVMRPDTSESGRGMAVQVARAVPALLVALPVLALTGRFVYGVWPEWTVVARGIVVFALSVPVLALGREIFASRLSGDD